MRCAKCGRSVRGAGHPTPLGERVCASCHDTIAGASLGLMSGSNLGTGSEVGGAVLGAGLMARLRRMWGRGDEVTTDLTGVEARRADERRRSRLLRRRSEREDRPSSDGGQSW